MRCEVISVKIAMKNFHPVIVDIVPAGGIASFMRTSDTFPKTLPSMKREI
jgi:hypothetical protein